MREGNDISYEKSMTSIKEFFYIILAAFGFAFMNLFVKLAGDLPAIEKSFFSGILWQFFFAFSCDEKKQKIPFYIPKGSGKYIFFRSLFLERSGFLQTFMQSASCILRMRQCLINYLPFLPLSFLISC